MKSFWSADSSARVPVAKPRLPSFAQIAPYLRRIDQAQWYSNAGPLVQEFESRLAQHCGNEARVAAVANATLGLTLALLALDPPQGALCMVPSWTFAATGHSILLAGLVPWMVDVSCETWALEADAAREFLSDVPGQVAAVIPVSPFGAPIDLQEWRKFRDETGVAVIVDSAASFDSVRASDIPQVVSLHATKVCGVGEGGFVVSTQQRLIEEIQKRANFGFWNSRESTARAFNGKLSEYAAAVGLASLDNWPEIRADFMRVAGAYRQRFQQEPALRLQPGFGHSWVAATVMIEAVQSDAETLTHLLEKNGIGSRRWWGGGLHQHAAFKDFPRLGTVQSEILAEKVLGLPCWRDLPNDKINRICDIILSTEG